MTTPTQIEALFDLLHVSNQVARQSRRLLIGLDARDVQAVRQAVDALRGLLAAHGRARADALGAITPEPPKGVAS